MIDGSNNVCTYTMYFLKILLKNILTYKVFQNTKPLGKFVLHCIYLIAEYFQFVNMIVV